MKSFYLANRRHFLKLLSVLIAFFVWIYVLNSERLKFEKQVKIEYRLKEQMVFAIKPISEVTFVLDGPRAFMRSLVEREDVIEIDLTSKNPQFKKGQYTLRETDLSLPYGVKVDRIIPRRLNLQLDKKISKNLSIKYMIEGELPDPLFIKEVVLDPPWLEVEGPRSVVNLTSEVKTKPIDIQQLVTQRMAELFYPPLDSRLSLKSSSKISIYADIKAKTSNKKLIGIQPRLIGDLTLVQPTKFEVSLWVDPSKMKSWGKLSKEIQIIMRTPDQLSKDKQPVMVKPIVNLPQGIYLHELKPELVQVKLP